MNAKPTDFGERKVDFSEPQFVFAEAVEIVGIPAKTLNNWTQRKIIDLGVMHRTGRRLYSIVDLVQLKIVTELSMLAETPPTLAATIGAYARKHVEERTERDAKGELKWDRATKTRRWLTVKFRDGVYDAKVHEGNDWLTKYSHPHTFIVIPLDDINARVWNKALDVLEREWKKEEGSE